jgi:DNA modification methylase
MVEIISEKNINPNADINQFLGKIINGDTQKLLKMLPNNSIDLVVTSPPYDDLRDYDKDIVIWNFDVFKKIADGLYDVMKPGGVIVWVVGDKTKNGNKSLTSFRQALYFQNIGFNIYDVIIYEKAGAAPPHPRRYFNAFEYMFIISKGKPKTVNLLKDKPNKWAGHETYSEVTRREKDGSLTKKEKKTIQEYGIRTNIWRYNNGKGFSTRDEIAHKHPAIFPEKLAEDHIKSWSNPGDIVLDIFGGSGTTIKMAALNNRKWIYFDKVEEYCEIAFERINALRFEGVQQEISEEI